MGRRAHLSGMACVCARRPLWPFAGCGVGAGVGRELAERRSPLSPVFSIPATGMVYTTSQPVLLGRFGQTPPKSWRELARSHPASNRTLSRWCASFSAYAGRWASGVLAAFSEVRGEFAIPPSASDHPERLTLSAGGLFLDWRERGQTGKQLDEDQLLQRLWGWGSWRLKIPLLSSTTFVEGLRPGREPKRGPPIT